MFCAIAVVGGMAGAGRNGLEGSKPGVSGDPAQEAI
jgi:hypothetical protein